MYDLKDLHQFHPNSLFYLASPYNHPDVEVRRNRAEALERVLHYCFVERLAVFSPIHYTSTLTIKHSLPHDVEFWWDWGLRFMEPSAAMIVVTIFGWEQSVGVAKEIAWFKAHGRPIYMMDPADASSLRELD